MEGLTGLYTNDGKPIFSTEFVEDLRKTEENKKMSKFFIAQKGAQEKDLGSSVDILVTGGNRGGGKANTYNTPVATPSGFRRMGDLEVGDSICTPYEGIQKVTNIFEQGEQSFYHFHFDDGTEVRCMDNHRFWARVGYLDKFHEMTAREIMDNYKMDIPYPQSLRKGKTDLVEFPLCGEVEMNEKVTMLELPIQPFILGYISANGYWNFAKKGVLIEEKAMQIRRIFNSVGYRTRFQRGTKASFLVRGIPDEARRKITTSRKKTPARIPKEYMTACAKARWSFLQGVMYKSGYSQKKHPCLTLPNKLFIEDIAQLARSLGMWARVTQELDDFEKYGQWKVRFIAPDDADLFVKQCYQKRSHRNADKATSPYNQCVLTKKLLWVKKDNHKQKCRCITVSGNHHLYLTDAYTINHNTALMLMEDIYDINNKHFNSVLFRKNKDDFDNIENESKRWFYGLGKYNKSRDDMTWNFRTGAKMSFDHFDMTLKDFEDKYRGQQYGYIGVDEFPQMPFDFLKILMGSNRNTVGVRSRIVGTCNPDPLSWLRKFIDWWIGKEDTVYSDGLMHPERKGFPIPERDGVVRYCFMGGKTVDDIRWGNTPQEVYEQCKNEIDAAWDDDFEQYGWDKMSFAVKSVTFIKASIKENKALLKNDPGYVASILNKSPEERAKEWDGNWDVVEMGNDLIQPYHLNKIFTNAQMLGDKIRRATCDVAGTGGDNCVTWLWVGWHVADVFVCRRDPYSTVNLLKAKLHEWGVLEQNFCYDLNGMGQVLKGGFPKALPFNNQEAVAERDKGLYDNKKSQCAYKFAERTQQAGWSIENSLLYNRYKTGGEIHSLRDILLVERKCVRQDMSRQDRGWCLIHKEQMKNKSLVGHSPDFFEALFMREIFDIKRPQMTVPKFLQGHIKSRRIIQPKFSYQHN